MSAVSVSPHSICFERTALELNPRWEPASGLAGTVADAARTTVRFRCVEWSDEVRRELRELEEIPDLTLTWRGSGAVADGCRLEGRHASLAEHRSVNELVHLSWQTSVNATRPCPEPHLLGIVNVTADSFSDGGRFLDPERAIEHGLALVADGADALDVGGESTRPGSEPVSATEERARVVPVIEGLRAAGVAVPISIDTQKSAVATVALDVGATWVNDVSAGRTDPDMLARVAERGCDLCLMHMQGTPRDMQANPTYGDVVDEVLAFLRARVAACLKAGIDISRISVDPGIGFGKRLEHNLELLRRLPELRSLGLPLLLGVSRKSFIAHVTRAAGRPSSEADGRADGRVGGTAAAVVAAVLGGARWLRVHDVRTMGEAARVAAALRAAPTAADTEPEG